MTEQGATMTGEPEIIVVGDADEAAAEAARRIVTTLRDAVAARGRADWATTGGSTPVGIYRRIVETDLRDEVPWAAVHTWWGDDRFVPSDHPLSNLKPFDDIMLDAGGYESLRAAGPTRLPIPPGNVHPFRIGEAIGGGRDAVATAAELAAELRAAGLDETDGWPILDLVLLGIGGDGHLLSVFPGSEAFDAADWALAVPAPTHIEPHVERVTLNPAIVGAARHVLVVAQGAAKAEVLGDVFGAERDPRRWPAQLARRAGATWILDEAAAANVPR